MHNPTIVVGGIIRKAKLKLRPKDKMHGRKCIEMI